MKVASILSLSLLALASASSVEEEISRELFMVNTALTEGATEVSGTYAEEGYTSDHLAICDYRLYGTPPNRAAGDRAMRKMSKIFKKRFNRVVRKMDKGKYADADAVAGAKGKDHKPTLVMTHVEVFSQQTKVFGEEDAAARRLSEDPSERNLFYSRGPYSYGSNIGRYICTSCGGDDRDGGRRRLLQSRLAQADFARLVLKDLKNSKQPYLSNAAAKSDCFEVRCDGGNWIGTEGCNESA